MKLVLVIALLVLSSCDETIDWVVPGEADYGHVFICEQGCAAGNEYCFGGDAEELSALKDDTCREVGIGDRKATLLGCAYDCAGKLGSRGANAKCGAYCP